MTAPDSSTPRLRVTSAADMLAVIPHLLGFVPSDSVVLLAVAPGGTRVEMVLRLDLPTPSAVSAEAAIERVTALLSRQRLTTVVVAGYGPGHLVTPIADAAARLLPGAGFTIRDILRIEDGRWWSYTCTNPACCPPEGTPFAPPSPPLAAAMARTGTPPLASRGTLAATIAPLTGRQAHAMKLATRRADKTAAAVIRRNGWTALAGMGLAAVQDAIGIYQAGRPLTGLDRFAWLAQALTWLPVRDDAWARMQPDHREAHMRLWADLTRHAQPGQVAAPATLLAFTAWQAGNGALANLTLDRALDDQPGYSAAVLIRECLDAALPPARALPPATPDEVARWYAGDVRAGRARRHSSA